MARYAEKDTDLVTIQGVLEKIVYLNEENHFTIARVQEEGKSGLTTVVGNLTAANCGEHLRMDGRWTVHTKYGEQFQVLSFQPILPATLEGIRKYLGSGLV